MANGTTPEGRDWKVIGPEKGTGVYPKDDTHTWGEFAGLAIEIGGYSDITAVDPYTGRRFWLADAFKCDAHASALHAAAPGDEAIEVYSQSFQCDQCSGETGGLIRALRRLVDAMDTAGFLDSVDEAPVSRT